MIMKIQSEVRIYSVFTSETFGTREKCLLSLDLQNVTLVMSEF